MRSLLAALSVALGLALIAGCGMFGSRRVSGDAAAQHAHDAYVTAINSNNLESILGMLTDDVVMMAPNEPALVGKAAVRPWADGYLKAYAIHWEKTSLEFIISGDWAFERYAYKSMDTPRTGGAVVRDTGKGLNIYHREADGTWRVARDAWSSDLPPAR